MVSSPVVQSPPLNQASGCLSTAFGAHVGACRVKYGEHRETGAPVAIKACSLALIQRWRTAHGRAVSEGRSWSECRIEDPQSEVSLTLALRLPLRLLTCALVQAEVMRVLASPGHPHVIRLDQVLQDPEYLYIVMEFANGGDLFDILRCPTTCEPWSKPIGRGSLDVALVAGLVY